MLKARASDQAKSKFLANMAHELRTPLNAIIGFSEIINSDNIQPRENYPEYAGYIRESGILLLKIINDILELARVESGKVELDEQIVSLDELIQSVIITIQPIAQERSIEIHFDLMQSPAVVRVDNARFKQILLKLLSNAVKFTKPGGRIQIILGLEARGDLLIAIRDTGIGIPPERLEKVLEPFEQVADYLTRENQGIGLGLPIAKLLVELHGGELVLSSDLGIGTTATLRLPGDRVHCLASSGG
jgi:signal transduction histidine kinase